MKVKHLVSVLTTADPETVVLYLDPLSEVGGSEEIFDVFVPAEPWIYERGLSNSPYDEQYFGPYEVRYPGKPRVPNVQQKNVTHRPERVVVISTDRIRLQREPDL